MVTFIAVAYLLLSQLHAHLYPSGTVFMSNFVPNIQNAAPLECRPPLAGSAGAVVTPLGKGRLFGAP